MNPSLQKALADLRGTSATAAKIIDNHFSGFQSISAAVPDDPTELRELVTKLLETIEYQSNELERLADKIRIPDRDLTEDTERFKETLKPFDVAHLVLIYDRKWFRQINKEQTRKALAKALVDYAIEKQKKPSDVWVALVNNNGALED